MEMAVNRAGTKVVFVDYIQKLKPDKSRHTRYISAHDIVTESSERLALLAARLDIHVCTLSQLTMEKHREGQRPRVSDLRQTKQIEQDSALINLGFRPGYKAANPPASDWFEIKTGKNRHGDLKTIRLPWYGPYCQIGNLVDRKKWSYEGDVLEELPPDETEDLPF